MKHKKSALLSVLVALMLVAVLAVSCENETPKKDPLPEPELIDPADYPAVRNATVDPVRMWDAIHYGLFTDQKTTFRDPRGISDSVSVDYTLFIPEKITTRHPLVLVAVPSGVRASDFAVGPTGSDWIRAAEAGPHKFAVAFVEAQDGGDWNIAEKAEGRDEGLALFAVFKEINDTGLDGKPWKAFYSLDKNRVSLVGYDDGASAALLSAAEFPAAWANVTLFDLPEFDTDKMIDKLSERALPYASGSTSGYGTMKNKDVPMAFFLVDRDGDRKADKALKSLYDELSRYLLIEDKTDNPSLRTVRFIDDAYAKELYDSYLSKNGRYLGYAGGTIRENFELDSPNFELHEDEFTYGENLTRANRFLTYVPENLDKEKPVSLVLALHGMSAALTDLISECRLNVLAESENFIVCYCQAPIAPSSMAPNWDTKTQIAQLQHNIDWCLEKYPFIDKTRVYAMGHSMGAMSLATNVIPNAPGMFAAVALNGGFMGPAPEDVELGSIPTPVIGLMAQYDFGALAAAPSGNDASTLKALKGFAKRGGFVFDDSTRAAASPIDGYPVKKYTQYNLMQNDIPLESFVGVAESPHTFMAEEAMISWDWMKHWTRDAEGHSLYDGECITLVVE